MQRRVSMGIRWEVHAMTTVCHIIKAAYFCQYRKSNCENYLSEDYALKSLVDGGDFQNHSFRKEVTRCPRLVFSKRTDAKSYRVHLPIRNKMD